MPLEITLSDQARVNLLEIRDYISVDSVDAAKRMVLRIWETLEFLSAVPGAGRDRSDLNRGLRSYPVGNYLILYRVADTDIKVSRVLHGARDLNTMFDNDQIDTFRMSEDAE